MTESRNQQKCFIIMPVTTPEHFISQYKDDTDHFSHVLDHLFIPSLEKAGFEPIPPKSTGSEVIQAEIIKHLASPELVLCDMSILNPNVFFEFGIRTALNKPVALVVDDKTKTVPFDTSIINFHKYSSSMDVWSIDKEKENLSEHIKKSYEKTKDYNALWKYFGLSQTGMFKPEEATLGEKIDLLMQEVSALKKQGRESISPYVTSYPFTYESLLPYKASHHGAMSIYMAEESGDLREKMLQRIRDLKMTIAVLEANMPKAEQPDSGDGK